VFGRQFVTLVEGIQGAGTHDITFEAAGVPSGTWLNRLEAVAYWWTPLVTPVK
jgi:hypothetical protein